MAASPESKKSGARLRLPRIEASEAGNSDETPKPSLAEIASARALMLGDEADLRGAGNTGSLIFATAPGGFGGRPALIGAKNLPTLVDAQKFRNNWWKTPLRDVIAACRRVAEMNWFGRPVLEVRHAVTVSGFRVSLGDQVQAAEVEADEPAVSAPGLTVEDDPEIDLNESSSPEFEGYDFEGLMNDIVWEDLVASNVVALWRKGERAPLVAILDGERLDYRSSGGLERITLNCPRDEVMANDRVNQQAYINALGERMYKAYCTGGSITIIRGLDQDWQFEAMTGMKRRGEFCRPEMTGLLDDLDLVELLKVGDWNLGFKRKDVLRLIKVGYAVTQGATAGAASVNITPQQVKNYGEGFSQVNGTGDVPLNHDVNPSYLTLDPKLIDAGPYKAVHDRLLLWGGIEALMLMGSFSQGNGAAPSLMHNMRVKVKGRRQRCAGFLRRILEHEEFCGQWDIDPRALKFRFSVKLLYSIEEIQAMVSGMADGLGSPQTRRELLDLDDREESRRMREAWKNRQDYVPPFEAKQGQGFQGSETKGGRPAAPASA